MHKHTQSALARIASAKARGGRCELVRIAKRAEETLSRRGDPERIFVLDAARAAIAKLDATTKLTDAEIAAGWRIEDGRLVDA